MPRRAQTLALAVHELATNAAKYGALSNPSGKLTVSWNIDANGLAIQWLELGGPEVVPPNLKGYGTRVIKASLDQLGGAAGFDWRRDGLVCQLSMPLGEAAGRLNAGRRPDAIQRSGEFFDRDPRGQFGDARRGRVDRRDDDDRGPDDPGISRGWSLRECARSDVSVGPSSHRCRYPRYQLGDDLVYPLADAISARGTPFVFVSGYGVESLHPRFSTVPVLQKPVDIKALRDLFAIPAGKPAWHASSRI